MRIFLVGFMGSGKSHWGKIWAGITSLSFIDLDAIIEQEEKLSIDDIFSLKGEAYFRKIEEIAISKIENIDNCIVACGGGTPCYGSNMMKMNQLGSTVYLKATPDLILNNLSAEIHKRPLLKNIDQTELRGFVSKKLKERAAFYEQSGFTFDASLVDEKTIFSIIN
jgi:shikimate kinase